MQRPVRLVQPSLLPRGWLGLGKSVAWTEIPENRVCFERHHTPRLGQTHLAILNIASMLEKNMRCVVLLPNYVHMKVVVCQV